jgi:hypothetical protein
MTFHQGFGSVFIEAISTISGSISFSFNFYLLPFNFCLSSFVFNT